MPKIVDDPEVATVAIVSLTKMVSLLAAELVVGMHRDDIDLIETCVRKKLYAAVEGIGAEPTAAGVALAHRMVEPVLRDLRARVEALAATQASAPSVPVEPGKRAANARLLH
jgi:malate/lactate dehydrogenase